ncbi:MULTISPECIES: DoxX family protein [Chryseobacterium]|uniref:DoxX family protein n=1 Tax=Chryseobacterium sp. R2A-55 TaxID=2744445 RepID=UPI001F472BA9|nr:DoxX family protein [Chryseobacterium sp. R2A-55]
MGKNQYKLVEWFLRISLSIGFLSAVADRFGIWPKRLSKWGNWDAFLTYTHSLLPFLTSKQSWYAALTATSLEIFLGVILLVNFRTVLMAKISGFLLLAFGVCMAVFLNIKAPLDYSVFSAAAAAFALSLIYRK